jgi:hypothetical protein
MRITVPESLKDITLDQYQKYQIEIDKSNENENQTEILALKKLEIFCNLKAVEVYNIQLTDVVDIANKIELILQEQPQLVQKFDINGVRFGFVPDLDKISYGEFLDLNNNIAEWQTMVTAMGVLYRPIKNETRELYNIEKYKGDKYHKILKDMPMSAVMGSLVFFWNLGADLAKYIIKSSEVAEVMKQTNLQNSGGGTQQSLNYLGTILESMKILPS